MSDLKLNEIINRYGYYNSKDITAPTDFPGWRQVMSDLEYLFERVPEAELEDIRQEGYEEGYEDGKADAEDTMYESGYRAGYKDAQKDDDPEYELDDNT